MKNNRSAKHFLPLAFILIVLGCQTDNLPDDRNSGKAFMPLQVGRYQVYDIHEIKYQLGVPETLDYELKISVTDSLPTAGGYTYVLTRSTREVGEVMWTYLDTWSARVNAGEAVLSEGNVSYLKIRLPLIRGTTWNGNVYNTGDLDDYELSDLHVAFDAGDVHYPDCIVIVQSDNDDYIVFLDQRKEVYARDVGLIYKEVTQLNYCTTEGCLGKQEVESGVILKQTILDYGVE